MVELFETQLKNINAKFEVIEDNIRTKKWTITLFFIAIFEFVLNIFSEEIAKFTIIELNVKNQKSIRRIWINVADIKHIEWTQIIFEDFVARMFNSMMAFIGETNDNDLRGAHQHQS